MKRARRYEFDDFVLDPAREELRRDGEVRKLARQPFQLLELLVSRGGEIVSREAIQQELWKEETFVDFEHNINFSVRKVREALGDVGSNPRFIQTVRGRGYRFLMPVTTDESSEAEEVKPLRSKWSAAMIAGAAVAIALWWFAAGGSPPVEINAKLVAVLPFDVRGGSSVTHLGDGMVDLLTTRLGDSAGLRTVDARAVLGTVTTSAGGLDPEKGSEVAIGLGAGLFVLGSVIEAGTRVQLDASLYDVDKTLRARASAEAPSAAALPLAVDALAIELLREQLTGMAQAGARSTTSLTALKAFLEGERLHRLTKSTLSRDAFARAVEADPTFALAWYYHAVSSTWIFAVDDAIVSLHKALDLGDKLSTLERARAEALLAWLEGFVVEGERGFQRAVGIDPMDAESWAWLGTVQREGNWHSGRPAGDARDALARAVALDPGDWHASWYLRDVLFYSGARENYVTMLRETPGVKPLVPWEHAALAWLDGDAEQQAAAMQALTQAPDFFLAATIADAQFWFLEGWIERKNVLALIELLEQPERDPETRALAPLFRSILALVGGRARDALEVLPFAFEVAPAVGFTQGGFLATALYLPSKQTHVEELLAEIEAWDAGSEPDSANPFFMFTSHDGLYAILQQYLLGIFHAGTKDFERAEARAEALSHTHAADDAGTLAADFSLGIRARIAWERGDATGALAFLEKQKWEGRWFKSRYAQSSPFLMQAHDRYLRARALHETGRLEEALSWYGSFSRYPSELIYVIPAARHQAEIYERLGRRQEAIAQYERFVSHWAHADPELRGAVATARSRLEGLRSATSASSTSPQ